MERMRMRRHSRAMMAGSLLFLASGARAESLEITVDTVYQADTAQVSGGDTGSPVMAQPAPTTTEDTTIVPDKGTVPVDGTIGTVGSTSPMVADDSMTDSTSDTLVVAGPYVDLTGYRSNIFIFGDDRVPYGFDNAIMSFNDDKIVYDSKDHNVGILPQYVKDREVGAGAAASYVGYDDIATLWEGRSLGPVVLSGETVDAGGVTYLVSGTLETTPIYVNEDGVQAEFYPLEDGQCNLEGVALDISLPVETFEVSSATLTISKLMSGSLKAAPTTTTVEFSGFPVWYTARGTFLLDYGTGGVNGLAYDSHAVFGVCAADPAPDIDVLSGTLSESTIEFILQQILCTSGSGTFAEAIDEDTFDMMLDTQDGFGQYFTDSILRWNPLTSGSAPVSYSEIRYHEVEGVDVAELVMSVSGYTLAPSEALYLEEDEVAGTSGNLSASESKLESLLRAIIPSMLTGSGGEDGTEGAAEGCDYEEDDTGVSLTCDCEEMAGIPDCEVSMTIEYPTYVWTYEDGSGVERTFEVDHDWRAGSGCDAPIREVRARNLAFHVILSDIHFSGTYLGFLPFNIYGSGGFTAQGLTLAMDFDTLAQRGDPEAYDCMNRLSYCLSTVDLDDEEAVNSCIGDSDGSSGGPSGAGCSIGVLLSIAQIAAAESDAEVQDALDQFDDEVEPSTFSYRGSWLDLGDFELAMHLELHESNLLITESDLEDLADEIMDMIWDRVYGNLEEMAATDDLLGGEGAIIERIYGYRTARDLVNAAGMDWSTSFQVGVRYDGSEAAWSLIHRRRTP